MGDRKSQVDVKFYVDLLWNILADSYSRLPDVPQCELERDFSCVRARVESEGLSFLTKTLPKLGKALDRALETGSLTVPSEFATKRKHGVSQNIPAFLSALFATIFTSTGSLCSSSSNSVGDIRQICYVVYKVEAPVSASLVEKTLDRFVETDASITRLSANLRKHEIVSTARGLLSELFRGFNPANVRPRHGPGAVADRLQARDKYKWYYLNPLVDEYYPYSTYITGEDYVGQPYELIEGDIQSSEGQDELPVGDDPPARVCLVPKDSRGPRIISCEPTLLQYLQQGLGRAIVDLVEAHPLTEGRVNFTDQSINQRLAWVGSAITPSPYATLDMKDASDRVSLDLVQTLFPRELLPYLEVLRSDATQLPDGRVVRLQKFAPMGSALCFPVEALVFWSLATAVVAVKSLRPAREVDDVFVYGDDIIVRPEYASAVVGVLPAFGLQFNTDKCYVQGRFRESCGGDYFLGEDVTPVKIRTLVKQGHDRRVAAYRLSKSAMHFFDKGFWRTSEYLWTTVESWLGYSLPMTSPEFAGISRTSKILPSWFHGYSCPRRWNKDLQRVEVKTIVLSKRKSPSPFPTATARLLHNLINGCGDAYDVNVAVSADSALPKISWAAAF